MSSFSYGKQALAISASIITVFGGTFTYVSSAYKDKLDDFRTGSELTLKAKDERISYHRERSEGFEKLLGETGTTLQKSAAELKNRLDEAEGRLQAALQENQDYQNEIDRLKGTNSPSGSDRGTEIEGLKKRVNDLTTENTRLQETNHDLSKRVRAHLEKVNDFELSKGKSKNVIPKSVWVGFVDSDSNGALITVDNVRHTMAPGQSVSFGYGSDNCNLVLKEISGNRKAKFTFGCSPQSTN